ncbi:hypothetical protein LY76DRAFT_591900 [Colletotrichum caudatum]|nr:hypothetical protein LY76DRAFT_591900 [Colletotrichum caudatum]
MDLIAFVGGLSRKLDLSLAGVCLCASCVAEWGKKGGRFSGEGPTVVELFSPVAADGLPGTRKPPRTLMCGAPVPL